MEKFRQSSPTEQEPIAAAAIEIPREEIDQAKNLLSLAKSKAGLFTTARELATSVAHKIMRERSINTKLLRDVILILLLSNFAPGCKSSSVAEIDNSNKPSDAVSNNKELQTPALSEQAEQLPLPRYTEQQIAELVKTSDKELAFVSAAGTNDYYQIAEGAVNRVSVTLLDVEKVEEIVEANQETVSSHIHPVQAAYADHGVTEPIPEQELRDKLYSAPSVLDLSSLAMRNLHLDVEHASVKEISGKVFDYNGVWKIKMGNRADKINYLFTIVTLSPEDDVSWVELKKIFNDEPEREYLDELMTRLREQPDRTNRMDEAKGSLRILHLQRLGKYEELVVDLHRQLVNNISKEQIDKKIHGIVTESAKQGFNITFHPYE